MLKYLLTALFTITLLFSAGQIYRYLAADHQAKKQFNDISGEIQIPALDHPAWTVSDQYGTLFDRNGDMAGWIAIDGTTVDYPVMYTPADPDFYLKHDFGKQYSGYGVPYVSGYCTIDPPGDNIIIFSHNMRNGRMFGALEDYKEEAFYRNHPVIRFDTRAGFGLYEIIAVFKADPYEFAYHQFINATDQADFGAFIHRCKELSFFDTGMTAVYGDRLLTLSTCEYSAQGSRMAVVAKRMG